MLVFISMQKINFITHFFLEIFQRYYILVILSTLGMPGCPHQIWNYQIYEKLDFYLFKNKLHIFLLSRDTAKILQACYFEYFRRGWPYSLTLIESTCRKLFLYACKKSTSCLHSFLIHCKDIANLLAWVLWSCLAKTTENDCICFEETLMFNFMQKIKSISHLFLAQ